MKYTKSKKKYQLLQHWDVVDIDQPHFVINSHGNHASLSDDKSRGCWCNVSKCCSLELTIHRQSPVKSPDIKTLK